MQIFDSLFSFPATQKKSRAVTCVRTHGTVPCYFLFCTFAASSFADIALALMPEFSLLPLVDVILSHFALPPLVFCFVLLFIHTFDLGFHYRYYKISAAAWCGSAQLYSANHAL